MVLKRLFILLFSLISIFSFAQSTLFFTDAYNTNLYKSTENTITFSNNLFSILDNDHLQKVDSIFQIFFVENNINIENHFIKNDFQLKYNYQTSNPNYLNWSKNWFQKYEIPLLNILNQYTFKYLSTVRDTFPSIHEAAIYKLILNAFFNYNNRINDVTSTSINISSNTVDIIQFNKKHILPNNSLKRTITSAKNNFFNESFYFSAPQAYKYFIIGPNKKSRLIDCFSAHLFCNILKIESPVYLSNLTYIKLHPIDTTAFTQNAINKEFDKTKKELRSLMNASSTSFYNLYDLQNLDHLLQEYKLADFNKFTKLYLKNNTINEVLNPDSKAIPYNHLMLNDSIHFKVNSYKLKNVQDSINLASIAEFLIKNPLKIIQILGLANNNEYTKVDKEKYTELIKIYQDYTPIKVSKKIDLPLYRSLLVFEYLFKKGVNPQSMVCISRKVKNTEKNLAFVYFNYIR